MVVSRSNDRWSSLYKPSRHSRRLIEVLTGMLGLGALISGGLIRPRRQPDEAEPTVDDLEPMREAA